MSVSVSTCLAQFMRLSYFLHEFRAIGLLTAHSLIRKIYEVTFDVNLNRFTLTRPFSQNVDESRQLRSKKPSYYFLLFQIVKICGLIVILLDDLNARRGTLDMLTYTASFTFVRIHRQFEEFFHHFYPSRWILFCVFVVDEGFCPFTNYYLIAVSSPSAKIKSNHIEWWICKEKKR